MVDGAALRIVRVALDVLSMRLLTILSMTMSFGLALWTMAEPSWDSYRDWETDRKSTRLNSSH